MPFHTHISYVWKGMPDPSCLGVAGEETQVPWVMQPYLAQDNWVRRPDPRLMDSRQDPVLLSRASSPNSNGFGLQPDPLKLG
jgi:hypothetical protein